MGRSTLNNIIYSYKSPAVDNFVFRLLYRWTVLQLLVFSFIVTCKLAWGDSFSCSTAYDTVSQKYLDSKCYAEPLISYSPGSSFDRGRYASSSIYPDDDSRRAQTFYPWVNLFFLAQAMVFYLPHLLWKTYESGYVGRLTAGLEVQLSKEQKRSLELCYLAKFLSITQGRHKVYTLVYIFSEFCNFVIAIVEVVWLVNFFNVTSTPDYTSFDVTTWTGYRNFYFPSTGMCTFTRYATSSEPRNMDAVCVLSLNHLFMKLFLYLRVWYILLILATGSVLVYRVILMMPNMRTRVLQTLAPLVPKSTVHSVCHPLDYSDWFFLMALHKSLTDADFSKLMEKIVIAAQNAEKDATDTDDKSSVYEDTHKDVEMSPRSTPL
ncbi:innexin inx2 [Caerostris darwini]|uniref:Innexin n=1 Tax=Caerostris darwini TaxID=1538125 RepID=A0AAV4WFH2_9ARAC|nr:innexin inx2 [Caerostris darwini]